MVFYLNEDAIIASKRAEKPRKGQTVTGYGKALPTTMMIQLYNKRWYRVKAICFSNVASLYIKMKSGDCYIDYVCEEKIYEVQK